MLSSPRPHDRASSTSRAAERSWARLRASAMVPPLAKPMSSRSSSATRPTSSTDARIAACIAAAAARSDPGRSARADVDAGNSAEHQPPLRPDAPNPAVSASSTTTRSVGSARSR